MTYIAPIPTTRISSQLANSRLTSQLQSDLVNLQQIENQISSGLRMNLPSDDPSASLSAIDVERLLERTNQVSTNLQTNQAYLSQTDSTLSSASDILTSAQSDVSSVVGTTATDSQRQAAAAQVGQLIQQLVGAGNENFNGRYLFAGSQAETQPFVNQGNYVEYVGNAADLSSYSDINQLFQTNISGDEAFGAISTAVNGTANLTPVVTANTNLSDLNGGQGVTLGSIRISDGTNSSVVDLSHAATLGDVAAAIEANPPAGRTVRVDVTATGLNVSLDAAGGGNLAITNVGTGTTAQQLGIFAPGHVGTGPLVGSALDPVLTTDTSLGDLLGVRASAMVTSSGPNSGVAIEANSNGAAANGYTIQFVDHNDVSAGGETVQVDNTAKTVTVDIDTGHSSANNIVHALNSNAAFSSLFTAGLDTSAPGGNLGNGAVDLTATAVTAGGSGTNLDQTSGLQVVNGGQTHTIDISGDKTVGDLLNTLNGSGASLLAQDPAPPEPGSTSSRGSAARTFPSAKTAARPPRNSACAPSPARHCSRSSITVRGCKPPRPATISSFSVRMAFSKKSRWPATKRFRM